MLVKSKAEALVPQGLRHTYRDIVVDVIDRVIKDQSQSLDAARAVVVDALMRDRIVYVSGSGHSHMLAEEVFYRAGGLAPVQAILEPELMLHEGARRSTLLEREEGRAAAALAPYDIGTGDVIFIASNSGRNAYPIELALIAANKGATSIAITSLRHASAVPSRHSSGKRLFEIADIVIDNGGVLGDAALDIPGHPARMGPTSTIAGVFILNALMAEAVAELATRGTIADVYISANSRENETDIPDVADRWQNRIRGL